MSPEVVCGRLLDRLGIFTADEKARLAEALTPKIFNRAKLHVGSVRSAPGF